MTSMLKPVRTLSLLVLALVTACTGRGAQEPTPRDDLAGTWDLVAVNGGALPTASPEERSVILESVAMTLERDGAYSLASAFHVTGQTDSQQMTIGGTWRATDDVLRFETEGGPAILEFGYVREGDTLRMIDEQLHEWVMRRRS